MNAALKPKLIPVSVPWKISPSVPHLHLQTNDAGKPISATFIAYFHCDYVVPVSPPTGLQTIYDPGEFILANNAEPAPFRMVRVAFAAGKVGRACHAFADLQVIPEDDFDWTAVPGELLPGQTIDQNIKKRLQTWTDTGVCPDPLMYEVQGSPWLRELGLSENDLHHYILLGHDDYVEVIASGWRWEKGQPVD